jgi:hypothetical protein
LTNWKISVKIIKLPKQNWIAHYGNSDPLVICFNVFLVVFLVCVLVNICRFTSAEHFRPLFVGLSALSVVEGSLYLTCSNFIVENNFLIATADKCGPLLKNMSPDSQIAKQYQCVKTKTVCILNRAFSQRHYLQRKRHTYLMVSDFVYDCRFFKNICDNSAFCCAQI